VGNINTTIFAAEFNSITIFLILNLLYSTIVVLIIGVSKNILLLFDNFIKIRGLK
jgi:hypothetical protein